MYKAPGVGRWLVSQLLHISVASSVKWVVWNSLTYPQDSAGLRKSVEILP